MYYLVEHKYLVKNGKYFNEKSELIQVFHEKDKFYAKSLNGRCIRWDNCHEIVRKKECFLENEEEIIFNLYKLQNLFRTKSLDRRHSEKNRKVFNDFYKEYRHQLLNKIKEVEKMKNIEIFEIYKIYCTTIQKSASKFENLQLFIENVSTFGMKNILEMLITTTNFKDNCFGNETICRIYNEYF